MNKAKDFLFVAGWGLGALILMYGLMLLISLIIGLVISFFFDVHWLIASLFAFIGLRFLCAVCDVLDILPLGGPRCPLCKRRVKSSNSAKCEDCGGAVFLK